MKPLLLALAVFACPALATVRTVDGTDADFIAKQTLSSAGDTIQYPAGMFSSSGITISKAITVIGSGEGVTVLNNSGTLFITAAARLSGFTINPAGGITTVNCAVGTGASRAVMEHVTVGPSTANTIYWEGGGLISYCTFTHNSGSEGIWTTANGGTGDHTSMNAVWASGNTIGTSDPQTLYVENCDMKAGTSGYISDCGYATKVCFRFNVIEGASKLDVHGCETTYRSGRQCEAYFNRWTIPNETFTAMMDLRGGKLMVFSNRSEGVGVNWMNIHTYGIEGNIYGGSDHTFAPFLAHTYWTPFTYPVPDQTGNGADPRVGGADPAYVFNNYNNNDGVPQEWSPNWGPMGGATLATDSAGYSIGATSITITTAFDGQNAPRIGTAFKVAGDSHYYVFTSEDLTNARPTTASFTPALAVAIPATPTNVSIGPITQYQYQTSNPSVTFAATDMIKPDRDIFIEVASFNGTSGNGTGTKATMLAITPTLTGVGYWVTDEGSWNTQNNTVGTPGYGKGQGQLYTWSGSAWVLAYTPYAFPHPLAGGADSINAVTINVGTLHIGS